MGTISGFFFKFAGAEVMYFTAQLTTVSWVIVGPILFCIIVVLGFYIFKQFTKDEKVEDEDIKLGKKKGVIRKKNDP